METIHTQGDSGFRTNGQSFRLGTLPVIGVFSQNKEESSCYSKAFETFQSQQKHWSSSINRILAVGHERSLAKGHK